MITKSGILSRKWCSFVLALVSLFVFALTATASAADKPNILVIFGDDIGQFNLSTYNMGMMGYKTPNIDRIAQEGVTFTDAYGEQSCTAGRSAFITGQHPVRTGLTKVGLPGAALGIQPEDVTLAELLKPMGYMTGQFGKNHLGDRDEFLPTNHGFDEFFGNLYHLNAEDEPEDSDYPPNIPNFQKYFGPRGVIHSFADGRVEDTGPLTKKRMETVDEEFLSATMDFIDRADKADKPFFAWFNSSRMHVWTRLKKESQGVTGQGIYADGLVEHDGHVGQLLDKLKALGIKENTIVIYTTDNGAEVFTWPDGGMIPFRGEKNTTWEGGFRVPLMVSWPGQFKQDVISNEIISHLDWVPTLMAAAGEPDIKGKLKKGYKVGNKQFKVHLDGYNFMDHLTGKSEVGPRQDFFYFTDDGKLSAVRYDEWKVMFSEQRAHGVDVWSDPLVELRLPKIYNLLRDPFERADIESMDYDRWRLEHLYILYGGLLKTKQFVGTFKEFPPRQDPASFSVDKLMEGLYKHMQK